MKQLFELELRWRLIQLMAFILLAFAWFSQPVALCQSTGEELRRDIATLDSFLSNRNLDSIEATINKGAAKWQAKDHNSFVIYMTEACSLLSSYDMGDASRRGSLLARYAISALNSGDMTVEEQVRFVEFIMFVPLSADEVSWKSLRKQTAELSLAAWKRVASNIEPTFDVNDRPLLNVPAPQGSGVPSGSSPESIRDPKLRAEYEAAIKANSSKARRYNNQIWLKQNAPEFFQKVERYLVAAYSAAPADSAELERLLAQYVNDKDLRTRILEAIDKHG